MLRRCPDESSVLHYLAGEARDEAEAIERHVDGCRECREWIAGLARTSLGLSSDGAASEDRVPLGDFLPTDVAVGRYRILGVRGRGGMGVVYEAEDPELRRRVALKVLRAAVAGRSAARLLAEARAMARLPHPNVCPVFDVGSVHGRWFLAMALVERGTLADWLRERPRSTAEIVDMFAQAGQGLLAAHRIGVVHRDFKPSNVLIAEDGRPLVSDFGLAAGEHGTTEASGGTPHYMPPEQREGTGDARVDQFAFGVALADALPGEHIPRRLARVIERATARDPDGRFANMQELLGALERARSPERSRWWVPVAALGGAALVMPLFVPAAEPEQNAPESTERVQVGDEVMVLLDRSVDHDRANDPLAALAELDAALAIAEATGDRAGLALASAAHASRLGKLGRFPEAIDELERAFDLAMRIDRPDIAADAAIIRVGLLAESLHRPDDAMAWARHAEATLSRMDELDVRIRANFDTVMGRAHTRLGEHALARDRHRHAVDLLRAESPRLDLHLFHALVLLGGAENELGEVEYARRHIEEGVRLATWVMGPDHADVGASLGNLAAIEAALGDVASARSHLEQARSIIAASYGEHHPNVLAAEASIASLFMREGRYEESVARLERVLVGAPKDQPDTCGLVERLAASRRRLERHADACAAYAEAVECWTAQFGAGSPQGERAERGLTKCRERP
jgi:serine/threonine protein kinase